MNKELVAYKDTKSQISEMFRNLKLNLQSAYANEEIKTILITSTLHGEGKSFIASNLAITYANEGKKVILVDGDISNGDQYSKFEVQLSPGLSNYLKDSDKANDINEFIQKTKIENLSIITSGDFIQDSSELLVSKQMTLLINNLKKEYDIVIFDSTPSLLETDAIILSRLIDTTIIVTSDKKSKVNNINKVKDIIEDVGGKIAGIVLNKISMSKKEYGNIKITTDSEEENENNVEIEEKEIDKETTIQEELKETENPGDKDLSSEKIDILDKEIDNSKENIKPVKEQNLKKEVSKTKKTTKKQTKKTTKKSTKKPEKKAKELVDEKEPKKRKTKQPNRSKDILKQINKYLDNQ